MTSRLTRRGALSALGTVSLGTLLSACGAGGGDSDEVVTSADGRFEDAATCTLTAEQTEGPFYFDAATIRSDIREDRQGVPLRLAVRIQDAGTCAPMTNAVVDVWHCDAGGFYSGFEAASQGTPQGTPPGAPPGASPGPGGRASRTDDETYLRGAQVTNADGVAEFTTIYPGWYRGRTVHIHAKIHLDSTKLVTTQLYFDDAVTKRVFTLAPYNERGGRDTFNDTDGIIDGGGAPPMLALSEEGDGWLGLVTIGVEPG